jgi:membrane-anchored protein YejM (alkaline phosphatase superfamily)
MTEILVAATVVIALVALGFAAWMMVKTHKEVERRKAQTPED